MGARGRPTWRGNTTMRPTRPCPRYPRPRPVRVRSTTAGHSPTSAPSWRGSARRPPAAPTGLVTGVVARLDRRTAGDRLRRGLRATGRTTAAAHHTRPPPTPDPHSECAHGLWTHLFGP